MTSKVRAGDPAPAVCVVTGATSGIGYATALGIARSGAEVVGVGRSAERCERACERIRGETGNDSVRFEVADLSSQSQVRLLARRIRERHGRLDALVNNAGAFAARRHLTEDGIELQLAVNLLAPFLLSNELLPLLAASPAGRIISLSSGSHSIGKLRLLEPGARGRYRGLGTYGATKLAVVLWSYELARRLGPDSAICTCAVDPGLVNTDMGLKDATPLVRAVWLLRRRGGVAPDEGARTSVWLALGGAGRKDSGKYWKECAPIPSSPESYDLAAAAGVWDLASRLTGRQAPCASAS
jgi:NAD(P)-dependent dehydrogenase (short-subunit alcohol dehydrogenase family)